MRRNRRIAFPLLVLAFLYVGTYIAFRTSNQQRWERDGNVYVIFPRDNLAVYYLDRPLTYLDGVMTGMRFHFGPHR
jgi:hypothetical protein